MIFGGLQKFTLIDYPEKLAATIFINGCNFRCPFCYNPELVLSEKMQEVFSQNDILDFLKSRMGMISGVVLCGGEPTIEKDLPVLAKLIKEMGYVIKLDTNGSNPQMLSELIKDRLIDYVAMDVKAPKDKYPKVTNSEIDIEMIEESINILKQGKTEYEFRTTVVPLLLEKEDILEIAKWLKPAKRYFLQQFRAGKNINPEFSHLNPYSIEYLGEIQKAIAPFFEICQIRT